MIVKIICLPSDHGREFENSSFLSYSIIEGMSPMTAHHKSIIDRSNFTLQEMAIAMIHVKHLPCHFWAEVMNILCHIHN